MKVNFLILGLLALFYIPKNVNSQKNMSGVLTYEVNIFIDESKVDSIGKNNPEAVKIFKQQQSKEYIVAFENQLSLAYQVNKMSTTERPKVDLVEILLGKGEVIRTDLKSKTITTQKDFIGENFLIKSSFINWKITTETKMIDKYNVTKAIGNVQKMTRKGIVNGNVEVWFTNDIPINFGPKNFSGLPGLIVEVKDENNLFFKLKKIELNPKKIPKIDKALKGKKVSHEEFNEIVKKSVPGKF